MKPGFPHLSYEEKWVPTSGTKGLLSLTIRQTQKEEWPIFRIPTEVCWDDNCKSIMIDKRTQTYSFEFDAKPKSSALIDPDGWVLKEIQ